MDINDESPQLLTNVLNKKYRDTTTDIRTGIISEGHQMVYYSCRHERFNRESDSYCVLWIFPGTYAWFVLLNSKRCITITNAFQKTKKKEKRKNESGYKPSKIYLDENSEFYKILQ